VQEDDSAVASRSSAVENASGDLCAAVAVEFDEDECEVEDFVPVEIPPPMDEIQTHTLPTKQHSVSRLYSVHSPLLEYELCKVLVVEVQY